METINEDWLSFAKRALDWFIASMGPAEWQERRKNVVQYFHAVKAKTLTESDVQRKDFDKLFDPIAVYSDWISWYMYLIESTFQRPVCSDPLQWTRIYPFFATIGKDLDALQNMTGIDDRLKEMFNEKRNQPDSTFFELAVALLYHRNGWIVSFLKTSSGKKSPDLEVIKDRRKYWVECKRLAKVTGYAESERREWQKRSLHLLNAMRLNDTAAYAEIIFKVPIEETEEIILGAAFTAYVRLGKMKDGSLLENEQIQFKAIPLDIAKINKNLSIKSVRPNSPQMISALIGVYDPHGNYTPLLDPSRIEIHGPDEDELFVLNEFCGELYAAYIAKWDCIAEASIQRKAKDIKKTLSEALKQIPEEGEGIIHIGYETVMGPTVEMERHKKIQETVRAFAFGNKKIESVYCNTMQFLATPEGFDLAETTIFFEKTKHTVLENNLLFNLPVTNTRHITHWEEDLMKRKTL